MRKTFLEKCINLRLCRVALVLLFLVPAISSLQANPSQNKTISGVVTSATDSQRAGERNRYGWNYRH